ncbi:MAG: hypothetical protein BroJett022_06480 [Actinomycetes bacterium]|nr:MAG: hypothetical protein BroJett022_06480 [Actinomycetes bacterium]
MVLFLVLLFIVLPIAELYLIIQVGGAIGVWPTIALLLIDSFLGAWLLRAQGRSAWRRFQEALGTGRVPAKEVYDGAAIIFGAALLMSPGFITDIAGFLLLIPPSRAALRRFMLAVARRVGPARTVFFLYDRRPAGWRRNGTGPVPGRGEAPPRAARRDYDYDGSAREIPAEGAELGRGEESPR